MAVKCILTGQEKVNLSGDTMTGDLKVGSSSIGTNGYIEGTRLKTTAAGDKAGDFATIDNSGWIYKRKPTDVLGDIGGQAKITANGILKGDGTGTITTADETEVELVDLPQEIFWASDTTTTNAEIEAALSTGRLPVVNIAGYYYYYVYKLSENYHMFFSFTYPEHTQFSYAVCDNNNWRYDLSFGRVQDTLTEISLPAASWNGSDPYTQTFSLIVNNEVDVKVDVQPDENLYDQLIADGINYFVVKNVNGVFTAVAKGGKPSADLTVQITFNQILPQ